MRTNLCVVQPYASECPVAVVMQPHILPLSDKGIVSHQINQITSCKFDREIQENLILFDVVQIIIL